MADKEEIRRRIEVKISQGQFLASLLRVVRTESTQVQEDFVGNLSDLAGLFRDLFEQNNLIGRLPYRPSDFWPEQRGKAFAFIDGGVANIELPSAAPIGIRVGSYIVRPGDETRERESFNIELALVDDLFSPKGHLFDDDFDDLAKLRDAARMTSETAAAYRLARNNKTLDAILVHGPLVNPVAPYGLMDFPPFSLNACRVFRDEKTWKADNDEDVHFIPTYLDLLERMEACEVPIVGVVERSVGRDPVVLKRILYKLQDDGNLSAADVRNIIEQLAAYGLNDATLLDVALTEGEYTKPIPVNRQGPESKWPEDWKAWIRKIPPAYTAYLKPSDVVLPFRIEAFESIDNFHECIDLIFHTSRLLPSYGFPVGLDIVDKFAKVPSWMSRGVKGQHQIVLLKKALESGDPRVIAFAKRVLTAKGRDWLFRPSA